MAESVSQDEVHQEGTEYIKDTLEQRHETQGIPEAAGTTDNTMSDTAETTTIPAEISANTDKANEDREEPSEHKPPAPAGGKPGTMENRDAIPTAGGEKLGDKHWGESQIVPDNPKPAAEEAGVSSKEGQPTGEVANNTAKNTGGASSGPQNSGEKQKFTDKVKDKLPFGKKDTN